MQSYGGRDFMDKSYLDVITLSGNNIFQDLILVSVKLLFNVLYFKAVKLGVI